MGIEAQPTARRLDRGVVDLVEPRDLVARIGDAEHFADVAE